MIEEMKERLLEHKTVAAVLGTVLVMLVVFFAWSSAVSYTHLDVYKRQV